MNASRFVAAVAVLLFASSPVCAQWESDIVSEGADGRLTYVTDAEGNRVPDFADAGYGGGADLPTVPTVQTVAPDADEDDDTARIQAALDAVAALAPDARGFRGAVALEGGTFEIEGTLLIRASGVVLRGAGRQLMAFGGTLLARRGTSQAPVVKLSGASRPFLLREDTSRPGADITDAIVPIAAQTVNVDAPEAFAVGDDVVIWHPATAAWNAAVDGGGTGSDPDWAENEINIGFARTVTAISGTELTLDAPLFARLDRSLSQSRVYHRDMTGIIEQVGIEDLRIEIATESETSETHARDAVVFDGVQNGWASGVTALHFWHAGFSVLDSRYVTVYGCEALEPHSLNDGTRRYNFEVLQSQLVLFQGNHATNARHAFVANGEAFDSGIVFLDNLSENALAASEGHRRWGLGLLYDNHIELGAPTTNFWFFSRLHLGNRGDFGTSHGWSCANCVAWNVDMNGGLAVVEKPPTAQNYAIGVQGQVSDDGPFFSNTEPYIEGTNVAGLDPRSLYLRQRRDKGDRPLAVTFTGAAGWRMLAVPYPGLALGGSDPDGTVTPGFLEPLYTAGYPGADIDEDGSGGFATVFLYDESDSSYPLPGATVPSGRGFWAYVFDDDDPFTNGTQGTFPKTVTVTGTALNSDHDFDIQFTPDAPTPGGNLLGNPYAEALRWDAPGWTKQQVFETVYVYDPGFNVDPETGLGDYRTWTPGVGGSLISGVIPPAQGFFVYARGESARLIAPASARTGTAGQIHGLTASGGDVASGEEGASGAKTVSPHIRFTLSPEASPREATLAIVLNPDASLGLDAHDAPALGAGSLRLVAGVPGSETALAVAAVPGEAEIPVYVASPEAAVLAWEPLALPDGWSARLLDRETGASHDLTVPGSLTLAASGASGIAVPAAKSSGAPSASPLRITSPEAARFAVVFAPLATDTQPVPLARFALSAPAPNPARGSVRVAYSLAESGAVRLTVVDALGREVAVLARGPQPSGIHEASVDASAFAPGVYAVVLASGAERAVRRFTVVR